MMVSTVKDLMKFKSDQLDYSHFCDISHGQKLDLVHKT